jgi:hypothetical protein
MYFPMLIELTEAVTTKTPFRIVETIEDIPNQIALKVRITAVTLRTLKTFLEGVE